MNASKLLQELYTYIYDKGKTLYRCSSKEYDDKYNTFSWFALHYDDAKQYNKKYIHFVNTKRPLKLINILHPLFQMDYLHKVNEKYPHLTTEKAYMLMPIGLPSLKAQNNLLTHKPGVCNHMDSTQKNIIDIQNEFYGGKHRYSFKIGDENMDNHFVKELQSIFNKDVDGYIIPHSVVSCFHPEGFHAEICLFQPKNLLVYTNTKQNTINGGSSKSKLPNPYDYLQTRETERMPTVAEINEDARKYLKRNDWNGPILYDAYGLIKIPTDKELFRYKSMRIIDDIGRDAIEKILQWRRKEQILTPHYDEAYWETVKYHKNVKPY